MEINITLNDLSNEQRMIAECIGLEAYVKLSQTYGGTMVYIAKLDKLEITTRNERIFKEYNGFNLRSLASKYNLSEQQIRNVISSVRSELYQQISLFEDK